MEHTNLVQANSNIHRCSAENGLGYLSNHYWNGMTMTIPWAKTHKVTIDNCLFALEYFGRTCHNILKTCMVFSYHPWDNNETQISKTVLTRYAYLKELLFWLLTKLIFSV